MVGFLNAHGTNPNLFSGEFQDLDFGFEDVAPSDELFEASGWVSIDELTDTPYEPFVEFTEDYLDDEDFKLTFWGSYLSGDNYDWDDDSRPGIALLQDGTRITLDFDSFESVEIESFDIRPLDRFFGNENPKAPSFYSSNRTNFKKRSRDEELFWVGRRKDMGHKPAKFRIDGNRRDRKDNRRDRMSIKHISPRIAHRYTFEEYLESIHTLH